jgi:hypothetical protein
LYIRVREIDHMRVPPFIGISTSGKCWKIDHDLPKSLAPIAGEMLSSKHKFWGNPQSRPRIVPERGKNRAEGRANAYIILTHLIGAEIVQNPARELQSNPLRGYYDSRNIHIQAMVVILGPIAESQSGRWEWERPQAQIDIPILVDN